MGWKIFLIASFLLVNAQEPGNLTNLFRQISKDEYQIGLVKLNHKEQSVRLPISHNMSTGLVEYVLVHSSGKIHESIFKTEVEPYQLHLAILLLSKQSATNQAQRAKQSPSFSLLLHSENGKAVPLESMVYSIAAKGLMTNTVWQYTGSRIVDGTFLAQRDGSIVPVIDDPDALFNHMTPGRENDENWLVASTNLPPTNQALELRIKLRH